MVSVNVEILLNLHFLKEVQVLYLKLNSIIHYRKLKSVVLKNKKALQSQGFLFITGFNLRFYSIHFFPLLFYTFIAHIFIEAQVTINNSSRSKFNYPISNGLCEFVIMSGE